MLQTLVAVALLFLAALVVLLWYGIRTHKTVKQLEAKLIVQVGEAVAKAKGA